MRSIAAVVMAVAALVGGCAGRVESGPAASTVADASDAEPNEAANDARAPEPSRVCAARCEGETICHRTNYDRCLATCATATACLMESECLQAIGLGVCLQDGETPWPSVCDGCHAK